MDVKSLIQHKLMSQDGYEKPDPTWLSQSIDYFHIRVSSSYQQSDMVHILEKNAML